MMIQRIDYSTNKQKYSPNFGAVKWASPKDAEAFINAYKHCSRFYVGILKTALEVVAKEQKDNKVCDVVLKHDITSGFSAEVVQEGTALATYKKKFMTGMVITLVKASTKAISIAGNTMTLKNVSSFEDSVSSASQDLRLIK